MKIALGWLLLACICSCTYAPTDQELILTALMRREASEGSVEKFAFKKLSAVDLKQICHCTDQQIEKLNCQEIDVIQLLAEGLNPHSKYALYHVNMEFQSQLVDQYLANEEGFLVSLAKEHQPLSKKLFAIDKSFMNGEQQYFVLISEDKELTLTVTINPNPIEFKWKDGAYFSVTMIDHDALIFVNSGQGFLPNEKFIFVSKSGKEMLQSAAEADANGRWVRILLPGVLNEIGGISEIKILRDQKEPGMLSFSWGTKASADIKLQAQAQASL